MTAAEQNEVCAAFNLGKTLGCGSLGGTRNQNFHLTTSSGSFVVRDRYVGYRDPDRIAFDHGALAYLAERDVPVVPPLKASNGETFWSHEQRLWEVFAFVSGHPLRDGDAEDVAATAQALAAFHVAGREYSAAPPEAKLGLRGETDPKELLALIAKLAPDAGDAVNRYRAWTIDAANALTDEHFASLPRTLIHGDIQPANIIIHGGKVATLIDLDWCARRPRIYDFAFAVLLCCTTHELPIDGGDIWSLTQAPMIDRELTRLFFKSYSESGWPLSSGEVRALRPQVVLSWCHCRLAGAMKVEPSRRREFLARPPNNVAALFPDGIT